MTLHVETRGVGPDLVLIHGWGMHGGVWAPVIEALESHFRLHLVDLPGLGRSQPVEPYTLVLLAGAVAQTVPSGATVCGWSMGGQVAMRWAIDQPESIGRLLLVGTTPRFVSGDGWDCGIAPAIFRQFAADVASDYRGTLGKFLSLQAHGGDASRATIRELRERFFERPESAPAVLQAGLDILLTTDLRSQVERISMPVSVLHGDHDRLAPLAAGEWLAAHVPQAALSRCRGASHAPFLSHPSWFVQQVMEFCHG